MKIKNILFGVLLCLMCNVVLASKASYNNIVIYNVSDDYPIEITYRICYFYTDYSLPRTCYPNQVIVISPQKGQNFSAVIPPEPGSSYQNTYLEILSATEKDKSGNIIAQSTYTYPDYDSGSLCSGQFTNIKGWIILNDMKQSPNILCNPSSYTAN